MNKGSPGPWFNMKMTCYLNRKPHCGDKLIRRSKDLLSPLWDFLYWPLNRIIRGSTFFNEMISRMARCQQVAKMAVLQRKKCINLHPVANVSQYTFFPGIHIPTRVCILNIHLPAAKYLEIHSLSYCRQYVPYIQNRRNVCDIIKADVEQKMISNHQIVVRPPKTLLKLAGTGPESARCCHHVALFPHSCG